MASAAPSRHPEIGSAYYSVAQLGADVWLARRRELLGVFDGADRIHLDLEGRLHRAWLDGESFQRGFDGRVRRVRVGEEESGRRWIEVDVLPSGERALARVIDAVARAAELASAAGDVSEDIADPLARAQAFSEQRYQQERERFARVYRPIPILPPDQNRAVVVQVTEGCSFNRCTFCHLYRDVRFRLRPPAELAEHVAQVRQLFGRALVLRRGVFLGQANALVVEQAKLLEAIRTVREGLRDPEDPERDTWPLGAFVDSFTRAKRVEELVELAELGLGSVALGLESGSARVLEGLGKPLEVDDAVSLVERLAEAKIRCGVIVLVGAGGRRHAAEHVEATVSAIRQMQLTPRDRVYLSPLELHTGSEYERRMQEQHLEPLSRTELAEQADLLRNSLRGAGVRSPIALYDIRRFIY